MYGLTSRNRPGREGYATPDIDFEKIRQEAFEKVCAELPNDPTKPVMKGQVNLMSMVAKEMLISYHRILLERGSRNTSQIFE